MEGSMAYVPGFKHDIFISYASDNNPKPKANKVRGWVTESKERLKDYLKAKLGRELKIWFDEDNIINGDIFDTKIRDALENSATILIFLSSAYLRSDWCEMERDAFLNCLAEYRNSGKGGIPGNERIFIARLEEKIELDIPQTLKGVHFQAFYRKGSGNDDPLCWPELLPTPMDPDYIEYKKILNRLGNDINEKLKQLKKRMDIAHTGSNRGQGGIAKRRAADNRTFYHDRLKECDGLVVIYGEARGDWVDQHLTASYVAYKNERQGRIYAAGYIIDIEPPPPKVEKEILSWVPWYMQRIDCTREFDEEKMKKFCKLVKEGFERDRETNPDRFEVPLVYVHAQGATDRKFAARIQEMGRRYQVDCIIH